jgi:anti-sigma regulatory factor (Ser/Thr protein kinase)
MDRVLRPKGGRLILAGATRNVSRVLEISGLIGTAPTVSAASDVSDAMIGLQPDSDPEPALWIREFEFAALPESLAPARSSLCEEVVTLGLSEAAMFDVQVAIGEALANAIRHGSPGGSDDVVRATITAFPDRVVVEVIDRGMGFDGDAQQGEDPYAPSGRGVMFMRALMDHVGFMRLPGGGTTVTMVKHR